MTIQFQNPQLLWALLLLLLPVLIHLFNFKRYKKVYFSNLRFLQNLSAENKKKSKIKRWFILCLRLFATACIVFVFAGPYLPVNGKKTPDRKKEIINLYIDNSFSMNADTESGTALEVAKNKSYQLIKQLDDEAKIRIFDNQIEKIKTYLNKDQAIAKVHSIIAKGSRKNLSTTLQQIKGEQNRVNRIFLFSDFQKNQCDFENFQIDSNQLITFLPLEIRNKNNLIVDSCWFENSTHKVKQKELVFIRIKNSSNKEYQKIPIKLSINDSIKAVDYFNIPAQTTKVIQLQYINSKKGIYSGKIEIDDHPVVFDNQLYFSYQIKDKSQVLIVNQNQQNKYVNGLFSSSDDFLVRNISKPELFNEELNQYSLLVLHQIETMETGFQKILVNFLNGNGNLLFLPADEIDSSINQFLTDISAPNYSKLDTTHQRIGKIELNSSIYQNVFKDIDADTRLPDVFQYYKTEVSNNNLNENLWLASKGNVLFSKTKYRNGNFYQLSFNLDPKWSNVVTHPIFVPSLLNLANEINYARHYHVLNHKNAVRTKSIKKGKSTHQYHIKNKFVDIIPQTVNHFDQGSLLYHRGQLTEAGNYLITLKDSVIAPCSFNYSRLESSPVFYSESELKALSRKYNLEAEISQPSDITFKNIYNKQFSDKELWRFFLIACIVFIALEAIISKK